MLLKNCKYIVTQNSDRRVLEGYDVLIEDGKIVEISENISGEGIDCSGKIVMPGLINTHTHNGMHLLKGVCDDEQLHDWLNIVLPKEGALSEEDFVRAAEMSCEEMLLGGTTCFAEMYAPIEATRDAALKYGIRCVLFPAMQDQLSIGGYSIEEAEKFLGEGTDLISYGVYVHSIYGSSLEQVKGAIELAKKHDVVKAMHVAETRKERFDCQKAHGKLPVEYLEEIGFLDKDTLLVHAVWLTKGELRILADKGVNISHCPVSNMKLASGGVMPLPEMQEYGVNVSLGTDGVVSNNNLDMFEEMKVSGLLHKHHRWDARCNPVQKILDMATINGAKALGLDKHIGSIEIGKDADIIALEISPRITPINNIISSIIYSAQSGDVTDVWVKGKHIVQGGRIGIN